MSPKLKHGSLKTNLEIVARQAVEQDQGDLKSSDRKEASEWLWGFKYGKMVEVDNKGRALKVASEDEEKKISYGLDWWVG